MKMKLPSRGWKALVLASLLTAPALFVCSAGAADEPKPARTPEHPGLADILSFETPQTNTSPAGWSGGPVGTIFMDDKVVHAGHWSARIERGAESAQQFSSLTKSLPVDFRGKGVELRAYLRTENVSGWAGLWMREDGESPGLEFANMQNRGLKGTTDWAAYSILLPVNPDAKTLFFGVLLAGTGKAWGDDVQLLVDGKPVWDAPKAERAKTALDSDHQFDAGSGVVLEELTEVQIKNLAMLGKVWGFLKYHHPRVTSGQLHWDYELFRVLPKILAAPDRSAANAALLKWIAGYGPVAQCKSCASRRKAASISAPNWIGLATKRSWEKN